MFVKRCFGTDISLKKVKLNKNIPASGNLVLFSMGAKKYGVHK
jgi:hypothetical protein